MGLRLPEDMMRHQKGGAEGGGESSLIYGSFRDLPGEALVTFFMHVDFSVKL